MEPLFGDVADAVSATGGCPETGVAVYDSDREGGVRIVLGYDCGVQASGFEVRTLPAVEQAVCAVHLGAMETVGASWQALFSWVEAQGWTPSGPCREIYLQASHHDQSGWVTELQQPVSP